MHKTIFAGLTELDANDPITVDGASFTQRNPSITDFYLRIGAVTHRHDAHPKLPDPQGTPTATFYNSGGQIPAGTEVHAAYTLTDNDGGETRMSSAAVATSSDTPNEPDQVPVAAFDSSAGSLPVGQFAYALTLNDAGGGESVLSPAVFVQRQPGFASGQVNLTNLSANVDGTVFVSWNLWRTQDGGDFEVLASGTADSYTDTGLNPTDASRTPPSDMTGVLGTNLLGVVLPDGTADPSIAPSAVSQINLYLSLDGTFTNPALYASYPVASAGANIAIPQLILLNGAPPVVSLATQGAQLIDPDTDMLDFPWKRPVQNVGDLPSTGNADGDVREVMATHTLYTWHSTDNHWAPIEGGGGGGGGAGFTLESFTASGGDGSQSVITGVLGFAGASGIGVHIEDLGGGSGVVWISQGSGAADTDPIPTIQVNDASGNTAQASSIGFVGASGTVVHAQDLGGGSARVTIVAPAGATGGSGAVGPQGASGAPGAPGASGAPGPAATILLRGTDGSSGVVGTEIDFAAPSGSVSVASLGGGSARVTLAFAAGGGTTGGGASGGVGGGNALGTFGAHTSAPVTMTGGGTPLAVNAIDYDVDSWFNASTYRFQPQQAGYYHIDAGAAPTANLADGDLIQMLICKNGSTLPNGVGQVQYEAGAGSFQAPVVSVSALIYCNGTTDYIDLRGFCITSTGSQVSTGFNAWMTGYATSTAGTSLLVKGTDGSSGVVSSELDFASGATPGASIAQLGGGSARVTIGFTAQASGSSLLPPRSDTASGYILGSGDAGSALEVTSATQALVTIPADGFQGYTFPTGTTIELYQGGVGQVVVAASGGVTLESRDNRNALYGQYATARLRKRAANDWVLSGDLASGHVSTNPGFVYDTFTDANMSDIANHTGESGRIWVHSPNAGGTGITGIASNVAQAAGTTYSDYYASASPPSADYTVSAVIKGCQTPNGAGGVWARSTLNSSQNGYALTVRNGTAALYVCAGGSFTQLGTTFACPDGATLSLKVQGSTISALVNGVVQTSVTNSSFAGAGLVGIRTLYDGSTLAGVDTFTASL